MEVKIVTWKITIIEHSISSNFLVPHNVNVESDQIECFEDVIIDKFLELIGDEVFFFSGSCGSQLTLDVGVINDMLKEKSECFFSGVQLNHFERVTSKMELDILASPIVLPLLDLVDYIFQGVTQE